MIKIAICDDDVEEIKTIVSYVSKYIKELDIPFKISSFSEGQDLIENIKSSNENFDIVFLDIYMKFSNGIDTARKIREFDEECKIIFITSSREHAVDSYEVRALYYILKPIDEEKLRNAVNIAIESLDRENKQISIKNKRGNYRIAYKNILYAESKVRVVDIHLKSGEIISFYMKLTEFFQSLQDERFLRCHKSFIVNMDYILKVENNSIFMNNKITIPISGTSALAIKEKYFTYLQK